MKTPTLQEIDFMRQQGKTFQQIADEYGCSKQHINRLYHRQQQGKMKVPSKAELYAQVEALTRENLRLQEQLDAQERKQWLENKDSAFAMFYRIVPFMPSEMCDVALDHIDKVGFWFTFELKNDNRKQTMCIRHTDL